MDSLRLDLRDAVRSLLGRPGFAVIAVITLALGIGVNTVAFTAINSLLLRPFSRPGAERLAWVMIPGSGNPRGYATVNELAALERGVPALADIAAEARVPVSLRADAGADQAWALVVSSNYLEMFSARPVLGRIFTRADLQGSDLPAVVSYRFWKEKLGSPASIGGRTIVVNGQSFSIFGVIDDEFQGPGGLYTPDMWLPLARHDVLALQASQTAAPWLTLFGRLSDGSTRAETEGQLSAAAAALSTSATEAGRRTAKFYPMLDGHPDLQAVGGAAWLALGVVGVVLVIACFNVAALLMARVTERQKEISLRCAVGASRGRILRQLVTEGLVLAVAGGAASLIVAAWSEDLLATFSLPAPIPQRLQLGVDAPVVAYTVLLVLVAGVLPAVLPALQATRANLLRSMHMDAALGGRPSRTRNAFVVTQIAGSTLFIVAALLFVRSFSKSASVDTGFDSERTAVLQLAPSAFGYSEGRSRVLFETLRDRLAQLPGVRAVAVGAGVPFAVGMPVSEEYTADGADCAAVDCRRATIHAVGAAYLSALGASLVEGRELSARDADNQHAVVISRHLAAQLWPNQPAVGRTFRLGTEGRVVQVVGVAADLKHRQLTEAPDAHIYRTLRPNEYGRTLSVVVGTHGDPREILGAVREQVRALDPDLPPASLSTMTERMRLPLWPARTAAGFFAICGALAMAMGAIGLFGVMYFTVSQRTREFGIRTALGATRRRVILSVLRDGLWLTIPGLVLGGIAGYVAGRLLARGLFGVSPADPVSFAVTAALEIAVALLACALPALRATRADPLTALRTGN